MLAINRIVSCFVAISALIVPGAGSYAAPVAARDSTVSRQATASSRNAPAPTVDLAAVAQGYAGAVTPAPARQVPALMIFVSFSMPRASLERLVEQAARTDAVLVLRGLENGSMRATAARIKGLIGDRRVGFQIDPLAFDRFGVQSVPTFVLAAGATPTPCSGAQCFVGGQFAAVAGDVTVAYALEYLEQRAPRFRQQARTLLSKIGGT